MIQFEYIDSECHVLIKKAIDNGDVSIEEVIEEFIKPLLKSAGYNDVDVDAIIVAETVDVKKVN